MGMLTCLLLMFVQKCTFFLVCFFFVCFQHICFHRCYIMVMQVLVWFRFAVYHCHKVDNVNLWCCYVQSNLSCHLSLTIISVMWPPCFCPSAAHFLFKQSVLNGHLSYTATKFWSPGWPLKTDLTVYVLIVSLCMISKLVTFWASTYWERQPNVLFKKRAQKAP
jgi:hypothetical protein